MCGICGEARFDGRPVDRDVMVTMRDRLVHRGPDAAGIYTSPRGSASLGFRRLSIIDLRDVANQPLGNEDGSVQVVFNGEIYNFTVLRDELLRRGHAFRSKSDTEVIVHLYEEYGGGCVDRLDGMFAFAIWDEAQRILTLARDRAGKKPLYYAHGPDAVVFGSEMKAFMWRRDLGIEIEPRAIPRYLLYGYVPCPDTFYTNVCQVEPGTVVSFGIDGTRKTRRYWSYGDKFRDRSDHADSRVTCLPDLREALTKAVERRMVSDVPLGAFLSGGLDSTIVVALMAGLSPRPIKTFSIGFSNAPAFDETHFARIVADRFRTDHTECIVEPGAIDLIEKLVWHHDGPFGDSSAVPTFMLAQLTRREVTVVLTGDGADELFAGYDRFAAALAAERIPLVLRRLLQQLSRHLPAGATSRHVRSQVKRFARTASLPLLERLTSWVGMFTENVEDMLIPELLSLVQPIDRLSYLNRFSEDVERVSPLRQLLISNFNTYLLDDLLVKTDRCTMANSLEARCPFLDTGVMELSARYPDSDKLRAGESKVALRRAFRDLVPIEVEKRPKMGFGVPFGLWFRGGLRDILHDTLLSSTARYRQYLRPECVHELVRTHEAGKADLGLQLWTLLTFEVWLRALPDWFREPSHDRNVGSLVLSSPATHQHHPAAPNASSGT